MHYASHYTDPANRLIEKIVGIMLEGNRAFSKADISHDLTVSPIGQNYESINSLVKTYIESHPSTSNTFHFSIGGRKFQVNIISFQKIQKKTIESYIQYIYIWFFIASAFSTEKHCSQTLRIFIYMTPFKKMLPDRFGSPIDEIHVNTGFTFTCKLANEIYVYRQEEWFKVLIHETFHSFHMDFSAIEKNGDATILKMFTGLHVDLRLYESYTEMWAEIIHTMFYGFGGKIGIRSLADAFKRNILKERKHSLSTANSILHHYGLSYRTITQGSNMRIYKEHTPAFAYYIVKSCWMYHIDHFIDWCAVHNGGSFQFRHLTSNISSFCQLYRDLYDDRGFIAAVNGGKIQRSLRMTMLDVKKLHDV